MLKKLKIVSVGSEVSPFSKTGGLADVARSLPIALKKLDNDVSIITPLYGKIIDKEKYNLKKIAKNIHLYTSKTRQTNIKINIWQGVLEKNLPIYFIENEKYFSRRKTIYGSKHENLRFYLFDLAALKLLSYLKIKADIIQCHDWHTGLIPYLLKREFKYSDTLKNTATVFTIHNLAFQMGKNWWQVPLEKKDYGRNKLPYFDNPDLEYINFAKRGIMNADIINTVSEHYREEIMTKKFGQDLHRILQNRQDRLFGIINGIDYHAYNPEKDPGLAKKFNWETHQEGKSICKKTLQKLFNLPQKEKTPLIVATSRIAFQKGFELLINALDLIMSLDLQLIIMGDGDRNYIHQIKKIQKKNPEKLVLSPFKQKYETSLYAGGDIFLLPSHHEPCGINQLIAMRYGCIPVVRGIGGLYDTVSNYNALNGKGNGFTFKKFEVTSLYAIIIKAIENYKHQSSWNKLIDKVMQQSYSWKIPAQKYVQLFKKAIKNHFVLK